MKKTLILSILCSLILLGCATKTEKKEERSKVTIFNVADRNATQKLTDLNLDDTHPNLLNPSLSEEDFEEVRKSWTDIHYGLNKFLQEQKFDWGIEAERVKIFNKIYFEKDGHVKYYVYRIYSDVPPEKMTAFGELAQQFFAQEKISVTRDFDFAQCGKASLLNLKTQQL